MVIRQVLVSGGGRGYEQRSRLPGKPYGITGSSLLFNFVSSETGSTANRATIFIHPAYLPVQAYDQNNLLPKLLKKPGYESHQWGVKRFSGAWFYKTFQGRAQAPRKVYCPHNSNRKGANSAFSQEEPGYLLDLALDQSQTAAYMIVVGAFLFIQLATNLTIHIHQYALLFKVVKFLRNEQTNSKQ